MIRYAPVGIALVVALVSLAIFLHAAQVKPKEVFRLAFFAGLLVFLMRAGAATLGHVEPMYFTAGVPFVVGLIGLIVYRFASGSPMEAGRLTYFAGLLVVMFRIGVAAFIVT